MTENSVQELRPAETRADAPEKSVNTKNYDAIIAERPAMQRTLGGKTITFPKFLPAKLLIQVRKAEVERKKKGVKQDDDEVMWSWGLDLLKDILGEENFDHIIAYGDLDITMEIVIDALEYYGLRTSDEDEPEGKVEAGAEKQSSQSTPLSSTSTPSTPISSDSTPESGTLSGDVTHPTGSAIGDSTSLESETSPKGVSSSQG